MFRAFSWHSKALLYSAKSIYIPPIELSRVANSWESASFAAIFSAALTYSFRCPYGTHINASLSSSLTKCDSLLSDSDIKIKYLSSNVETMLSFSSVIKTSCSKKSSFLFFVLSDASFAPTLGGNISTASLRLSQINSFISSFMCISLFSRFCMVSIIALFLFTQEVWYEIGNPQVNPIPHHKQLIP